MSVAFPSARPRSKGEVTQQTIQKVTISTRRVECCSLDGSVRLRRYSADKSSLWRTSEEMATGIVIEGANQTKTVTAM